MGASQSLHQTAQAVVKNNPIPTLAPPSPTSDDPAARKAAQDAMDAASEQERRQRGRAATLLTGASGLAGQSAPVSRRMLLGN